MTEFDSVIKRSLLNTLRSLGENCLSSVLSLIGRGREVAKDSLVLDLTEIDGILDEMFGKFSRIIKQVTILQACSNMRLEPPRLGNSLFWMVEELRSTRWQPRSEK